MDIRSEILKVLLDELEYKIEQRIKKFRQDNGIDPNILTIRLWIHDLIREVVK